MTDYISREAAIKRFTFATLDCLGMEPTICASDVVLALQSIPSADVRPVVFCGECKCYGGRERAGYTEGFCKRSDLCVGAFDFCSRGEKREES